MYWKVWLGVLLLLGSYAQMLFPRRLFTDPEAFFFGYPIVAGNLLAISATLAALGIIALSEGVCEGYGAPSLLGRLASSASDAARILVAAAVAGLVMEFFAQWLGKLWIYPYWTPWFYWLVLLPGFVFYWIAIAESYVAVKAMLDSSARPARTRQMPPLLANLLGVVGVCVLLIAAWRYLRWYATNGGYVFAIVEPVPSTPPFAYVMLAFLGALLVAEWALIRRGSPSLVSGLVQGYWVPAGSVVASSLLVSLVIEGQNAVNHYWLYTHFPAPELTFLGAPLSMFAAWPWQYLVFLLIPSLIAPGLATVFWDGPGLARSSERAQASVRVSGSRQP